MSERLCAFQILATQTRKCCDPNLGRDPLFADPCSRSLTLLGKITVLKNLIIPKIIYKVSHLPIFLPDNFVNELNQILFRFIWGSKWEKISRLKLC